MVRVNLIEPSKLADQHLIAEYDEILMLLGYVRRHPSQSGIPPSYRLGKGHILFFKDKLRYLKRRHGLLKKEMKKRNFAARRTISLREFPRALQNNWTPEKKDFTVIKERLRERLKRKPSWYRYYGERKPLRFFLGLVK